MNRGSSVCLKEERSLYSKNLNNGVRTVYHHIVPPIGTERKLGQHKEKLAFTSMLFKVDFGNITTVE